jgi:hypothetical protein
MSKIKMMAILCGMLISQVANSQKMRVWWSFSNADGTMERAWEDYCSCGTVYLKNTSLFGVSNSTPNGYPIPNNLTGTYIIRNSPAGSGSVEIGRIPASQWPYGSVYAFQVPCSTTFYHSHGLNFTVNYHQEGMIYADNISHTRSLYLQTHFASVNAGPDQTLCDGSQISVSPSGATTYSWSPAIPSVANTSLFPTTTTYTVTGSKVINTNSSNPVGTITCKATDAMNITVNPPPNLLFWRQPNYCTGTPLPVLTNSPGLAGYVWLKNDVVLPGEVTNSLNTASYGYGTYRVVATNANGCSASRNANIHLNPSAYENLSANFTSTTSNNSSSMTINSVATQTSGEHRWELYNSNAAGDLLSTPTTSTAWSSSFPSVGFLGLQLWQYHAVVHYIKDNPCGEVRSQKRVFYETARREVAGRGISQSGDEGMLVYPNPSVDVFTVEFGTAISGQLEIIDLLGKKIQSKQLDEVSSYQFDLAGYAKGIYTLNVNIDGVNQSKKIVLQ